MSEQEKLGLLGQERLKNEDPEEPTTKEMLEYFYRISARWGGMIPEEMRCYEAIRKRIEGPETKEKP